jgi:hypothetical protein
MLGAGGFFFPRAVDLLTAAASVVFEGLVAFEALVVLADLCRGFHPSRRVSTKPGRLAEAFVVPEDLDARDFDAEDLRLREEPDFVEPDFFCAMQRILFAAGDLGFDPPRFCGTPRSKELSRCPRQ